MWLVCFVIFPDCPWDPLAYVLRTHIDFSLTTWIHACTAISEGPCPSLLPGATTLKCSGHPTLSKWSMSRSVKCILTSTVSKLCCRAISYNPSIYDPTEHDSCWSVIYTHGDHILGLWTSLFSCDRSRTCWSHVTPAVLHVPNACYRVAENYRFNVCALPLDIMTISFRDFAQKFTYVQSLLGCNPMWYPTGYSTGYPTSEIEITTPINCKLIVVNLQ